MEFTQEIADSYVGGQLEIEFGGDVDIYRGQIAGIQVTDDPQLGQRIEITLEWKAVLRDNEDEDENESQWVAIGSGAYRASTRMYTIFPTQDGEIAIASDDGDLATLIPPDGETIDPAGIVGLNT
jgi:hypothetical protein